MTNNQDKYRVQGSTLVEPDRAILVGVGVNTILEESALDELAALCETCNIQTAARIIQNRKDIDVTYYVGRGKVDEIAELVREHSATVVVFDVELSGSKQRNLEGVLNVPVLDRSRVILDIFARRAQSMEGKLQVELAQLKYNLPRLIGSGGLMSKMRNAVGMRGPGEKKLELDKRRIREDISELEKQLKKMSQNRTLNKNLAQKSGKPRVCLVGYTNSGKSTLLNSMTKAGVLAEDMLFATLDPKTSNIFIADVERGYGGKQILLTDTVGFIDKLPHEFINAFESTLDEARYADLLLHVVDISNEQYADQIAVVNSVLKKIGADHVPTLLVLNKIDKLSQIGQEMLGREFGSQQFVAISAKRNEKIDELKQQIVGKLDKI
ncbi:MAG: GTPase HflX [Firmicutes bacterium]|nr:GTPase HflX [Bacillota bacterium]